MTLFSIIFILAIIFNLSLQLWLDRRHAKHIKAHRGEVPEAFAHAIPLAAHQKAADYTLAKLQFGFYEALISTVMLLLWTLGGGLDLLDTQLASLGLPELASGVMFMLGVFLLMSILGIPSSLYQTFVIEERFGFNRTTRKTFYTDLLKQAALLLVIGAPLTALVLWLMSNAGEFWWFYVWATWMGFSLIMMWAYPAVIAPMFNKFRPLEQDGLRQRIESLLSRNGFSSQGIFVMDGSQRSSHGNAYFTGFGANKRIVFFDTLLKDLEDDEIEAVLAHELGHFKCRHVIKNVIVMAILSLLGLAVLGTLIQHDWFYHGLGISQPSVHTAMILFLLVSPMFTVFIHPMMTWMSRKYEFEADSFAAKQANPATLIQALVKLYKENANTLTPDPLYSAFHDSHPPAPVRVAHLEALKSS